MMILREYQKFSMVLQPLFQGIWVEPQQMLYVDILMLAMSDVEAEVNFEI